MFIRAKTVENKPVIIAATSIAMIWEEAFTQDTVSCSVLLKGVQTPIRISIKKTELEKL